VTETGLPFITKLVLLGDAVSAAFTVIAVVAIRLKARQSIRRTLNNRFFIIKTPI
jgi:hypothetical protein